MYKKNTDRYPNNEDIKIFKDNSSKFARFVVTYNFLRHVTIRSEGECWEWQGAINVTNDRVSGQFKWAKKNIHSAHTASYELFVGSRHGLCVCHSCDNPICVNPKHLWLGAQKQNMEDMTKKGRHWKHNNPHSYLTKIEVSKIRRLYHKEKYTIQELADKFGRSRRSIFSVVENKTWKI